MQHSATTRLGIPTALSITLGVAMGGAPLGCSEAAPQAAAENTATPNDTNGGAGAATPAPSIPPEVLAELEALEALMATTPDTEGTGPFPAMKEVLGELPNHVVYRPRTLPSEDGEKLGLYVFGNGGCSDDGASSRLHLLEVASHGYLAIAPGRVANGPGVSEAETPAAPMPGGAPMQAPTTASDLLAALDWALAEAERPESPFYRRLDPAQVAVSGYSCGGLQALELATDPRVATAVIMNSGTFAPPAPPLPGTAVSKDDLANIQVPLLYILGGPDDIAYANGMDDFERIDQTPIAAANIDVGHGGTYWEPNGGAAAAVTVDWLAWILRGDATARERFVGAECGLCTDPEWTYEQKNLDRLE